MNIEVPTCDKCGGFLVSSADRLNFCENDKCENYLVPNLIVTTFPEKESNPPLADMRGCKSLHEYAVMLEQEVESLQNQLSDAMVGNINITELVAREKELGMKLEGSILHVFAAGFVHHFHAQGATNFLEVEFCDPEDTSERYTLTIQKLSGMRPAIKAHLTKEAAIELMNAANKDEADAAMQKLKELTAN